MVRKILNSKGIIGISLILLIGAVMALVMVPRVGVLKNEAKEAGIRTNILVVEGLIQSVIDDYTADTDGIYALESKINTEINLIQDNQNIRNPITGNAGCDVLDNIGNSAIVYDTNDNTRDGVDIDSIWTSPLINSRGYVAYCAYVNTNVIPNRINVRLIPYGMDDTRITELEKVVSQ